MPWGGGWAAWCGVPGIPVTICRNVSAMYTSMCWYANAGFKFNGRATDRSKFRNPDTIRVATGRHSL